MTEPLIRCINPRCGRILKVKTATGYCSFSCEQNHRRFIHQDAAQPVEPRQADARHRLNPANKFNGRDNRT